MSPWAALGTGGGGSKSGYALGAQLPAVPGEALPRSSWGFHGVACSSAVLPLGSLILITLNIKKQNKVHFELFKPLSKNSNVGNSLVNEINTFIAYNS